MARLHKVIRSRKVIGMTPTTNMSYSQGTLVLPDATAPMMAVSESSASTWLIVAGLLLGYFLLSK